MDHEHILEELNTHRRAIDNKLANAERDYRIAMERGDENGRRVLFAVVRAYDVAHQSIIASIRNITNATRVNATS